MNRYLTKQDIELENRHIKRCLTSHVTEELQMRQAQWHMPGIPDIWKAKAREAQV